MRFLSTEREIDTEGVTLPAPPSPIEFCLCSFLHFESTIISTKLLVNQIVLVKLTLTVSEGTVRNAVVFETSSQVVRLRLIYRKCSVPLTS